MPSLKVKEAAKMRNTMLTLAKKTENRSNKDSNRKLTTMLDLLDKRGYTAGLGNPALNIWERLAKTAGPPR